MAETQDIDGVVDDTPQDDVLQEDIPQEDIPQEDIPEEVTYSIGDTEPESPEQELPELRKSYRALKQEMDALEQRVRPETAIKPNLSDPGIDFDTEKYDAALYAYHRKMAHEEDTAERQRKEAADQRAAFDRKVQMYTESKAALNLLDFDDAEDVVADTLSVAQQTILLTGAENPAKLIYALGKSRSAAKALAAHTDPIQFAFAVARMEKQVKTTSKRTPPAPERVVAGRSSVSTDSTLERLRSEAMRTGDFTKVVKWKSAQRAKNR
jgi:hypothetical protein